MPELPEVETIRRGLASRIVHQPIGEIELRLPKMIRGSAPAFCTELQSNAVRSIDRQGKLLIFHLQRDPDKAFLLHLKMTGQLIYRQGSEQIAGGHPWPSYNDTLPNQYSHVTFHFESGAKLFFNDQRQFGYIKLVNQEEVAAEKAKYGIEPLTTSFTRERFVSIFTNRKTKLKALLLNQKILSGIGNIYADEICYYARLRPDRSVKTLTTIDLQRLYDAAQVIISTAIHHHGTTISDYADANGNRGNYSDFLHVYQRETQPCHRCSGTIVKMKVASRGTHFCTECQK